MDTEVKREELQLEDAECHEGPSVLEEITIEEMAVDGICGIY